MLSYLQHAEDFWSFPAFSIHIRSFDTGGITALLIGFIIGPKLIRFLQNFGARQAFRDKDEVGEIANLHEQSENSDYGWFANFWIRLYILVLMGGFECLCSSCTRDILSAYSGWICG